VVRGVYEKSQMEDTVNEIWTDLEKSGAVKEKDVQSWDNMAIAKTGIFGDSVAHSKMMWENRQSPKLHRIYSNLIGTEDLLVSLDRVCVMRPTKGVPKYLGGEEKVDHPEWKTVDAWFHWDLNPWFWTGEGLTELEKQDYELEFQTQKKQAEKSWQHPQLAAYRFITEHNGSKNTGLVKVQGLVALVDSRQDDGGFITVPGFTSYLSEWTKKTKKYSGMHFVGVKKNQKFVEKAQKITMRAGSVVIWNSCQPHCNFSNNSSNFRFCQYIKMFPTSLGDPTPAELKARAVALRSLLPRSFKANETGQQVFGLKHETGPSLLSRVWAAISPSPSTSSSSSLVSSSASTVTSSASTSSTMTSSSDSTSASSSDSTPASSSTSNSSSTS